MARPKGSLNKLSPVKLAEKKLARITDELRETMLVNRANSLTEHLNNIKSKGEGFEQDPLFGYPINPFTDYNTGNNNMWGAGVPVSAFPREIYPDRPSTLRTQIAMDAMRLESRSFYETSPNYSGLLNHLRNFIIGAGLDIKIVACDDADEDLAKDVEDYIGAFKSYKQNKWNKRVFDSVLNMFRDGEDFIRLFPEADGISIRSVDSSTVRGPHNEITGPWAYGILTDWPHDYEDIKAFHVWYSDNTHEDVSPNLMKMLKAETVGSNVKRGIPIAYRIRKQLEQIIKLSDCSAVGEAARQAIPYIIQYQLLQAGQVNANINSRMSCNNNAPNFSLPNPKALQTPIHPGEAHHMGPGTEFVDTPEGHDATWAYLLLCNQIATAVNVPCWMVSGSSSDTNFASSLVSESPLIKMIQHFQLNICEYFEDILKSVVEIAIARGLFPVDTLGVGKVEIHCEFPSPVARNKKDELDADIQLVNKDCMAPQTLCSRNNLNFEEQQDLIKKAQDMGWDNEPEIERETQRQVGNESAAEEKTTLEGESK